MAKRPLTVATPGEEPATEGEAEGRASTEAAAGTEAAPVKAAPKAALPDQDDVDPSTIPYGKQVFTKQGWVCSTAPDPKRK